MTILYPKNKLASLKTSSTLLLVIFDYTDLNYAPDKKKRP